MQVAVEFGEERADFEIPDDRVVGAWQGPRPMDSSEVKERVLSALDNPVGFPALRLAAVPGDRVVVPIVPEIPEASSILSAVCETLQGAGVAAGDIHVLAARAPREGWVESLPVGVTSSVHDPNNRAGMAYLASTQDGRRIYLNRLLTDADLVVPVGLLGYDSVFGYRGPWSLIFPALSDTDTLNSFRPRTSEAAPDRTHVRPALSESAHVSWLLGCQFQVGIVPGVAGAAGMIAGAAEAVRDAGTLAVDEAWGFQPERRAELVVAGIGRPGAPAGVDELAQGLATAARLVEHGGKIVVLSRVAGPIGAALRRLSETDEPRLGLPALKGLQDEPDYAAAHQLANVLAWADVYLLSALPDDQVDALGMVAVSRPEEARKLAANSRSSLFVSQADATRARPADEPT
jgi:nickel-dependent lactate racemase